MNVGDVRSKEHLGIVTSDAGTAKFSFFVTPMKNRVGIVEGDFVVVDHPAFGELCPLLSVVKSISNYEEVVGTTLVEKSVQTVAVAEILGFVDLRGENWSLKRLLTPPNPGSKVFLPFFEFLEEAFVRNVDGGLFERALHFGFLDAKAVSRSGDCKPLGFYLDAAGFGEQHFLVSGMTGTGKTPAVAVLVEELANKTEVPVVVLDSFGEYSTVGFAAKRFEELVKSGVVSAKDYSFRFGVAVFAFDSETVKRKLEKVGVTARKADRFSLVSFPDGWREPPNKEAVRAVGEVLAEAVKPGNVVVLDGRGLGLEERRKLFSCCVDALWSCRVGNRVVPFVLVVEEAKAVEPELLERLASEGGKLRVSLCLVSQHPSEVSGRVLSQMGTCVMGRTIDSEDLDCLKIIAGEKIAVLPTLRKGEWIVSEAASGKHVRVSVRDRYSLRV